MKKIVTGTALCLMVSIAPQVHAQSNILSNLKNAIGNQSENSSSTTSAISSLLTSVIGTKKVEAKDIVGTWLYSNPAVVFESSNFLKSAGGAVASSTVEKKMQTLLTRVGITEGKMNLTFKDDNTFSSIVNNKTVNGKYSLDGAEITLSYREGGKGITGNISVNSSAMNITFKADKLLELLTNVGSKINNTSINTVSKRAASYDGMQLGFEYKKN